MPEMKVFPERPVIIALLILILLGGIATVIYGLLGGTIGQPPSQGGSGLEWQAIWQIAGILIPVA